MSEINKLELRIKNSKKWNTKELRMTIEDAQLLLDEINEIKAAMSTPAVIKDILPEHTNINISVNGGSFDS